ncbi:immunoglobulin lambda-like polypeptide 1 [Sarotherodon galilaeus]
MAGGWKLSAAVLLSVFVQVLSGLPVKCTVSHDGDRTTYALQTGFYDKDVQKPEFSWFNISKYVLANHIDQIDVVKSCSFNVLTVRGCIENLFCEGHINSKGKPLDYTANCTTVCPPEALPGDQGNSHRWIIAVIVIVIVIALVCIMCFLCCRNENLRRCRCGQTRGLYSVTKNEAAKPEVV